MYIVVTALKFKFWWGYLSSNWYSILHLLSKWSVLFEMNSIYIHLQLSWKMDAVNDIATPSFDFFPIISVIPLYESVSLLFSLINYCKCTFIALYFFFLHILVTLRHQSVPSLIDGLWSRNLSFSLQFHQTSSRKHKENQNKSRWFVDDLSQAQFSHLNVMWHNL